MNGAKLIQKKAAEWLALREARGFTTAEHAAFAEWCMADPRHAAIFSEVETAWRTFDRLAAYPHAMDTVDNPDLLARPTRVVRRSFVFPALAAAASVTLAALVWLKPWASSAPPVVTPSIVQVSPRIVRLPDGSEVELNTGSQVLELFTAGERRVRLVQGEAHFTVAKNPGRPFIVEVGHVAVRAVGTAFNVRLDSGAVEVLVTEGRVQVNSPVPAATAESSPGDAIPAPAAVLNAGQRVVVPNRPVVAEPAPPPAVVVETLTTPAIDQALAWQASRLVFDATPLSEVVARINRHTAAEAGGVRLVVHDVRLGALRISGRIRTDSIERFVEVLETNFGLVADRPGGGEITLRPR